MKSITIRLEDDIHKKLKMTTVAKEVSIQDVIESFIKSYVSEKNLKEK